MGKKIVETVAPLDIGQDVVVSLPMCWLNTYHETLLNHMNTIQVDGDVGQ